VAADATALSVDGWGACTCTTTRGTAPRPTSRTARDIEHRTALASQIDEKKKKKKKKKKQYLLPIHR
jgi:hypothetical protein